MERAVLTLATGKPIYIQMAVNLLRSLRHHHPRSDLQFVLATDQAQLVPADLSEITILELTPGQYGHGFSPKLHLDRLAPAQKTLFVDADCLCVGSLEPVFQQFAGRAVSAIGTPIATGEWFGDVAQLCQRFGLSALPKFNGGVYYLEKGELSDRIYQMARSLEPQYDEIGLVRLRNRPNDELLMALAMALQGESVIPDDGSILSDPQACPGPMAIDVLRGHSCLVNPPAPHPLHQEWYPLQEVHPVLVHFLGHHTTTYPYTREALRLALTSQGWPHWATDLWASVACSIPQQGEQLVKQQLRPLYHKLFGTRSVKTSARVIDEVGG